MINLPPYPDSLPPDWDGLTLREIQMRRALVQARMEIQKFKMSAHIDSARQRAPFFKGPSSLFNRLSGAFTMAEYAYFALKAYKIVSPFFKKRK